MANDSGRLRSAGLRPEPEEVSALRAAATIAVKAVSGVALFFGGWALFGYGFDFIDAHLNWPSALMVPLMVCLAIVVTAAIVFGAALVVASAIGSDTPNVSGLSHTGVDRG